MIETSLSFLGLGVQPPHASWGLMLNEAGQHFLQYPYLAMTPGIAIALSVLGFVSWGWVERCSEQKEISMKWLKKKYWT